MPGATQPIPTARRDITERTLVTLPVMLWAKAKPRAAVKPENGSITPIIAAKAYSAKGIKLTPSISSPFKPLYAPRNMVAIGKVAQVIGEILWSNSPSRIN